MLSHSRAMALSTTVVLASTLTSGEVALTTVKALASAPLRYANQPVTVTGRFRGVRALPGEDVSLAPHNPGRWDFVLEGDGAAVWVSGIRPAGWDFDLDPRSPADADRGAWLEVTGTFRVERRSAAPCEARCRQIWIEASDLHRAPGPDAPLLARPATAAPAVVFVDPVPGETEVPRDTAVRLQFSRALIPETLSERLRVSYASAQPLGVSPIPEFTALYRSDNRSVTIEFEEPLAALQTVTVELLEGITGSNGLAVPPAMHRFRTAR